MTERRGPRRLFLAFRGGLCRRARREGGRSAGSARRSSSTAARPLKRGSIRVRFFLPPRPNIAVPARNV